jgi:hypothetical protein
VPHQRPIHIQQRHPPEAATCDVKCIRHRSHINHFSGITSPGWKQSVPADVESMDEDLKTRLETQIGNLKRRIGNVIAQEETSATKA